MSWCGFAHLHSTLILFDCPRIRTRNVWNFLHIANSVIICCTIAGFDVTSSALAQILYSMFNFCTTLTSVFSAVYSIGVMLSPVLGLLGGKICEFLLRRTFNDEIREKGIILITVYTTYFVCEQIGVSGVLALVVLGIFLSYRRHSISPAIMDDNERFWDFFSFWANTLIFILAGILISKPIFQNSLPADFGYSFVI